VVVQHNLPALLGIAGLVKKQLLLVEKVVKQLLQNGRLKVKTFDPLVQELYDAAWDALPFLYSVDGQHVRERVYDALMALAMSTQDEKIPDEKQ
jgi:hypothetical protein